MLSARSTANEVNSIADSNKNVVGIPVSQPVVAPVPSNLYKPKRGTSKKTIRVSKNGKKAIEEIIAKAKAFEEA